MINITFDKTLYNINTATLDLDFAFDISAKFEQKIEIIYLIISLEI